MDSIPFAFCDAVVGAIKDLPQLNAPFRDAKWNKALQDHSANRTYFNLYVGFSDGKRSYGLFTPKSRTYTPFATLLQQVGPQYLRFDYIQCVAGWIGTETSKEELYSLLNSFKPFLNFPRLKLYDVKSKIPESDVAEFLSFFAKINVFSFFSSCNGRSVTEFRKHLRTEERKKCAGICKENKAGGLLAEGNYCTRRRRPAGT